MFISVEFLIRVFMVFISHLRIDWCVGHLRVLVMVIFAGNSLKHESVEQLLIKLAAFLGIIVETVVVVEVFIVLTELKKGEVWHLFLFIMQIIMQISQRWLPTLLNMYCTLNQQEHWSPHLPAKLWAKQCRLQSKGNVCVCRVMNHNLLTSNIVVVVG